MTTELCPNCRVLRAAVVSTFEKEIEENGEVFKMITKSYSCSKCNTFIRCEDTKHKITDEVMKYKELLDEGIITKGEFSIKEKELLRKENKKTQR
jgi:hypothetical protein